MIALHLSRADFTASDLVSAEVFEVLRRAPGVVRSITIDNPAAPGRTGLTDPVGDLSGVFDRFVAQCDGDPTCKNGYPDLAASWRQAYAHYQLGPPLVQVPSPDGAGSRTFQVLIDGPRIADVLGAALGNSDTYSLIPAAITAPTGDSVAAGQVVESDYYSFHPDAPWGTLASYLCAYDVHTEDPDVLALEAGRLPQFTRAVPAHWTDWCKGWKVPDVSDALSAAVVSPVPALLFRGDLSAFGNDDWMRAIQHGLSHAQTVTFPTLGATSSSTGCRASATSDVSSSRIRRPDCPLRSVGGSRHRSSSSAEHRSRSLADWPAPRLWRWSDAYCPGALYAT